MSYQNTLFLDACFCKPTARPPVWLMRQAGRYMKEYLAIKEKYSFLEMCKTPEVCADVTMLPVDLLGIDAAILFSDILVTAEAMGGQLSFEKGCGPVFANSISHPKDCDSFHLCDVDESLKFVAEGIQAIKSRLGNTIPLIGFAGAPFTIFSYLIEGRSSADFKKTKSFLLEYPDESHKLLQKITQTTTDYLKLQIKAGVDAVQLFDTWSSALSWGDYKTFCHPYTSQIIAEVKKTSAPIISFSKLASVFYPIMLESEPNVISFDWSIDLEQIKNKIPETIAIQGNIDPTILLASKPVIKNRVTEMVKKMQGRNGYIFNLGHGISPDIPFENVRYLVDVIKDMG